MACNRLPLHAALPEAIGWIWAGSTLAVVALVAVDCVRERRRPERLELLFVALGPLTILIEIYLRILHRHDDDEERGR